MIELSKVSKSFGATRVLDSVDLTVDAGELMVLLGPSGCGKTTLLRLLAGLERPDQGRIEIGGDEVASDRVWVPPEKRNVGLVFQDWALFPHMSVEANIGFGVVKNKGRAVSEMLDLVGLSGMEKRLPATLSGGQQQRVALARSLAPSPRVLLLDEPFSNLDAGLREQLRGELRVMLAELAITAVFVTHDRAEALELGDRIAIVNRGQIIECADPATIYHRPVSEWAARLVGDVNMVKATATGEVAESAIGSLSLVEPASGEVEVVVRPESLELVSGDRATLRQARYRGHETLYLAHLDGADYLVRSEGVPRWAVGDRVDIVCSSEPLWAFHS